MSSRRIASWIAFLLLTGSAGRAATLVFDYSLDANGFFSAHPQAKTLLEAAGDFYGRRLADSLAAIVPGGGNTWSARFFDPATGETTSRSNLTIASDSLLIYAGGGSLGGGTLGVGGPGGFSGSGSMAFLQNVRARGQTGALAATPTDFGPWGGSIRFDLNTNWYFDSDPLTTESFNGFSDFYSVALHELGHLLGVGTAGSWQASISEDGAFTGAASRAAFGGAVPLDAAGAHWASGTTSTVLGTSLVQEAAMDPSLTEGSRKRVTTLDAAALSDIGWMVVPEPATTALLLLGAGFLAWRRRVRLFAERGEADPMSRARRDGSAVAERQPRLQIRSSAMDALR